jgi:hypothetical protein
MRFVVRWVILTRTAFTARSTCLARRQSIPVRARDRPSKAVLA